MKEFESLFVRELRVNVHGKECGEKVFEIFESGNDKNDTKTDE